MNKCSCIFRAWRTRLVLASAALLLMPAVANAHGIGASDPNRPVIDYVWLGFKHLIVGWDHLLFILAIVLLAGEFWRATKLISMFVIGHSLTLMLATTNEWRVSPAFVDVVIALSVLAVAVVGLRGRPNDWRLFGGALFAVGLVHGLGLATRLLDLGVSDQNLGLRVLLFNIGIELGQAAAVAGFFGLGYLIKRVWDDPRKHLRPAFAAIAIAGAIGAAALSFPGAQTDSDAKEEEPQRVTAACTQSAVDPPVLNNDGHPAKNFYGPTETTPEGNFEHVIGDGVTVVRYRSDISKSAVRRLERLATDGTGAVVAGPGPSEQTKALYARNAEQQLVCTRFDTAALARFKDAWVADIRARP